MNSQGLDHPSITIDELEPHLDLAWKCGRSLFVIGDFGVGKTTTVSNFAHKKSAEFVTMVASMMDRLDLAGLPYGDKKSETTKFHPSSVIASLSKERNGSGPPAVLYLNEFNASPDSVQPAFLRLIGERRVGDLNIRDNVLIVADGNPSTASRLSRDLPEPTRRRFNWIVVRSSASVWCDYAARLGKNPIVPAFIAQQSKFFYTFDPAKKHHLCYACGASWDRLASDLDEAIAIFGVESEGFRKWVCGVVGVEAGCQFSTFLKNRDSVPNVFDFLKKPHSQKLPTSPEVLWIFLASVAQVALDNPEKYLDSAVALAARLFGDGMVESGAYLVRYLGKNATIGNSIWETASSPSLMDAVMKHPELVQALMNRSMG